jgi:hypothetical protein
MNWPARAACMQNRHIVARIQRLRAEVAVGRAALDFSSNFPHFVNDKAETS